MCVLQKIGCGSLIGLPQFLLLQSNVLAHSVPPRMTIFRDYPRKY